MLDCAAEDGGGVIVIFAGVDVEGPGGCDDCVVWEHELVCGFFGSEDVGEVGGCNDLSND